MKDHDRQIFWIDYFNSSLSRSNGRKVPTNQSVKNPMLDELAKAVGRLGLEAEVNAVAYPKRMGIKSGYVSVPKTKKKSVSLREIANMLATVRGESRQESKPAKK